MRVMASSRLGGGAGCYSLAQRAPAASLCAAWPAQPSVLPQVLAGETDSDSYAWSCVLREMGRGYGDGLYGSLAPNGDFGFGALGLEDPYDWDSEEEDELEDLLWAAAGCPYPY